MRLELINLQVNLGDITVETFAIRKTDRQDVLQAFDVIESYFTENKLPKEHQLAIGRLCYGMQTHHMQKPKKSPTLRCFFDYRKPNK